jgi:2-methylcitrate dehydratase PrpD
MYGQIIQRKSSGPSNMIAVDRFIAFASAPHHLPADAEADTVRHLRDTIGAGIAGSTAPHAAGVRATAQTFGQGGEARLLGTDMRLPAASAAFANGFQIHCLEWDAVHEAAVTHALSVPVAVLLAGSDRLGNVTPKDFLVALAVSVDIACRVGLAARSAMRFFRPATAGLLGSALGLARLHGLNAAQMRNVLGLAYSQVSGTMQAHTEGSIALPLQIAVAARAAVTAVDLVRHGLTGPHDVLDGPYGFYKLIEADGDIAAEQEGLGEHWLIRDVSTKPYPTGRAAHGVLCTLQCLQRTHQFVAADIEKVEAYLPPLAHRLVGRPYTADMTDAYARLCLKFTAALMLIDGDINPLRCTAKTFGQTELIALAARIHPVSDSNADLNALIPQRLSVTLKDGRRFDEEIPQVFGAPAWPMSAGDYEEKLNRCLALSATALSPFATEKLKADPAAFATCSDMI